MRVWALRAFATLLFSLGCLVVILINPALSYARKYNHKAFAIYSEHAPTRTFTLCLDAANELVESSELYDQHWKLDICLNDGSNYPTLIQKVQSKAFAVGFKEEGKCLNSRLGSGGRITTGSRLAGWRIRSCGHKDRWIFFVAVGAHFIVTADGQPMVLNWTRTEPACLNARH